jgi:hypothetical protein
MHMPKSFNNIITYVSGAVSRIFGLDDDNYPATGVQPFSGKIEHNPDKKHKANW